MGLDPVSWAFMIWAWERTELNLISISITFITGSAATQDPTFPSVPNSSKDRIGAPNQTKLEHPKQTPKFPSNTLQSSQLAGYQLVRQK
ncbi:hypothetical protein CMV_022170 [Castanea mollissima]|uniref:Uncharacterized protein n=1 Tax=Castanea mollissima TaxID=60419 RepID=A0A8J4V8B9_9ROSI|nr:hypothetical protein CMV_022170 [Castanea mollissima]